MELLSHLSVYGNLRGLIEDASDHCSWWKKLLGRPRLARLLREVKCTYEGTFQSVLGSVFYARLQVGDFTLLNYVIREEFDLSSPGHIMAALAMLVHIFEKWCSLETNFSSAFMLDTLAHPAWKQVKSQIKVRSGCWRPRRRCSGRGSVVAMRSEPLLPRFPSARTPQLPVPAMMMTVPPPVPPLRQVQEREPLCRPSPPRPSRPGSAFSNPEYMDLEIVNPLRGRVLPFLEGEDPQPQQQQQEPCADASRNECLPPPLPPKQLRYRPCE